MCWSQRGCSMQKIFGLPKPVFSQVCLGIFLLVSNAQSGTQSTAQYFRVPQKLWGHIKFYPYFKKDFLSSWNSVWRRCTDCSILSWVFLLSLWEFPGFLAEDLLQHSSCKLLRFWIVVTKLKQIVWIAEYQCTRVFRKVVFAVMKISWRISEVKGQNKQCIGAFYKTVKAKSFAAQTAIC